MVDVTETASIAGIKPLDPRKKGQREKKEHEDSEDDEERRAVRDEVAVLGSHGDLPSDARAAIAALLDEAEELRFQLVHSRDRTLFLEHLSDEDPWLHVLNRRAFFREVGRALSFVRRDSIPSALVVFDLLNGDSIKQALGHGALEAALSHAIFLIRNRLDETDRLGNLGGNRLGVVLAVVAEEEAREKAQTLLADLVGQPFVWMGNSINLDMTWNLHVLDAEGTVEAAVEAIDAPYGRRR
ncbi:MAG: GGDEF domain-containing protein [Rhodospirillales bacterium]|nr:GGDEF domain-containing protein [Rhodospirillales bacterium]MCW8861704.1 GGDEF domain-containing protein [Rhodospirillales bacterium]MCW8951488.1 GGDEF domain-containing protein [Rhodospirillales bacterium]MCW8970457.1 GGDEF domain-containing protein [Rhodospirillales bacterium]MCW9002974.1 GGDEF domain-containing protein [Rhodospirillales bacterium]